MQETLGTPGPVVIEAVVAPMSRQCHARSPATRRSPALRVNGLRGSYEKRTGDTQEDMLRSGVRPGQPGWDIEPRELWGNLCTDIVGLEFDGPLATAPEGYDRFTRSCAMRCTTTARRRSIPAMR
jgi:hypothetical protein